MLHSEKITTFVTSKSNNNKIDEGATRQFRIKTMTTQIISHNADNQLFATRQQALAEISRNEYTIYKEATTMPCSFDERQRNRYDLNRDDEMAINVFVIETEGDEPMLIGYMYDVLINL